MADWWTYCFGDEVDALRHCCDSVVDGLRHYEGGKELEDKLFEKSLKSLKKSLKIDGNRGLEGSKIEENRCLEASWGVLARLGASWSAVA